jgi:hypothetical protein
MSNWKGRVFALASLAVAACAMLSAGTVEAHCKGQRRGVSTIPSQSPVAAILRVTQPYSAMNQQQLSSLSLRQLKALIQLQQKQMRALQRMQKQPQLQATAQIALQQVQNQNDLANAALQQRQQQQVPQQRVLRAVGN